MVCHQRTRRTWSSRWEGTSVSHLKTSAVVRERQCFIPSASIQRPLPFPRMRLRPLPAVNLSKALQSALLGNWSLPPRQKCRPNHAAKNDAADSQRTFSTPKMSHHRPSSLGCSETGLPLRNIAAIACEQCTQNPLLWTQFLYVLWPAPPLVQCAN